MLSVIQGGDRDRKKKEAAKELRRAKNRCYCRIFFDRSNSIAQRIYAGVKYIITCEVDTQTDPRTIQSLLLLAYTIEDMIFQQPVRDIMNIFPVEKDFDGWKYECKDFFSTKAYLDSIDLDDFTNEEFFWNYDNCDIINFSVKRLLLTSKLQRLRGEKDLMQMFAEHFGVDSYTFDKEQKTLTNNNTGEVTRVHKPVPRNLRVIG